MVIGRLWVNLRWTCSKRLVTCGLMNAGGSPHTGSAAHTSALCASSGCPQKARGYDPSLSGRVLPHQAWSPYTRIAKCGISDSLFLQTMWASRKDGIVQELLTWAFHLVCIYVFGLRTTLAYLCLAVPRLGSSLELRWTLLLHCRALSRVRLELSGF